MGELLAGHAFLLAASWRRVAEASGYAYTGAEIRYALARKRIAMTPMTNSDRIIVIAGTAPVHVNAGDRAPIRQKAATHRIVAILMKPLGIQ